VLTIDVLGIGFPNKGAELMLVAIAEWASKLQVPARLAVSWDTPFRDRARYGLLGRVSYPVGARIPYERLANLVPQRLVERLGAVRDRDVNLVLDASGYAYGDPWGASKAHQRMGGRVAAWRRSGKCVVMLPQAFGPFREQPLRYQMRQVLRGAHRIYARDSVSFEALAELGEGESNVSKAPDFTCLVEGKPFVGMEAARGAIGIIPNHKTYELGTNTTQEKYADFLAATASLLISQGHKVVLILHEGEKDRQLCEEIRRLTRHELTILAPSDPREIKMAIGLCASVLTSRFHGFASALFQGVPVLATSWSHKYEELASDFGEPHLVIDIASPEDTAQRLSALAKDKTGISEQLAARSEQFKRISREMWSEIETLIQPLIHKLSA
jgi:polysaccharide pyruvyl transferase WcaK-like protein